MNIKKGDTIKVLLGKDNGKTGKVVSVDAKKNQVHLEGLNLYKKHVRPRKQGEKGEIVSVARPINASNVAIICPNCNKQTRVGHRKDGETKIRFCVKCKGTI
ncbi:MAG: 50S ribosomal protein L24 [Candidatus Paceibacterota bacterium]|jgi:large subunit ribosomal protein L24